MISLSFSKFSIGSLALFPIPIRLVSDHFPRKRKMLPLQKLASLSAPPPPRTEARGTTPAPPPPPPPRCCFGAPGAISAAADRSRSLAAKANRELSLSSGMATRFEHSNGVRKGAEAVRAQHMDSEGSQDPRLAKIASSIRVIPDFPKPGIMFQDITTLLLNTEAFKDTVDLCVERYREKNISVVAGEVISEEYSLEYGTDTMEMHVGAVQPGDRALIVDDLIATGGTLCAAIKLLERVGATVVECACIIELPELKGRDRLGDKPLFVLVKSDI
ncbi:adenine phosphoribosyltransferase 1-like isoform X2 [Syzygium oleosum]|uniref:adenine phosphoribosyltransferase 1-like isoform X2 n=1 Tax=Syzygium oleosum TaxID=219896 RepID=UPI0024BB5549|nr:adenine phosphoribosyltransferase 1-like isoform X2 [Syzygium oleosum]